MREDLRQGLLGKTDALGQMIADEMPPPEGHDAWEYRDLPWMAPDEWNLVMTTIGKARAVLIAFTEQLGKDPRRRGQFWVSPDGCARLKTLADAEQQAVQ